MPDPSTVTVDSTPAPSTQVLVYTAIRAVLQVLGAFGIGVGATLPDSAWMTIAGAVSVALGVAFSFYQKYKQARLDHEGSVASARGGKAVQVVPTSPVTPA